MNTAPELTTRTRTERLCDYLWNNQRRGFRYDVHDCRTFTTRWVDTELDSDYTRLVQVYVKRAGLTKTLAVLRQPGAYRNLVNMFTGAHANEPTTPWLPGDVAVFVQDGGVETLGVLSSRLVHCPGSEGLVSFDASRVICHWSLACLKQSRS